MISTLWSNPITFTQTRSVSSEVQIDVDAPRTNIQIRSTQGEFIEKSNWIERLFYREEALRGESSQDDCYQPVYFDVNVHPESKTHFVILASAGLSAQQNAQLLDSISDYEDIITKEREAFRRHEALVSP